MTAKSDYAENLVLNGLLRAQNITAPTTVYIGLCSSATADSNTGATAPELANTNGYSRQAVTFGAPSAGQVTNSAAVNFTATGGNWAQATHLIVTDSATHGAGNVLYHGPLSEAITVLSGQTRQFAIGAIVIGEG